MGPPRRRARGRSEDEGDLGLVWTRLRRMPIEARNEFATIELDDDGRVAVVCGGELHHAVVTGGGFVLGDHDVDAELALLALGSQVPPCLVYRAIWHDALADPAFLFAWADDVDGEGLRGAREDWDGNYWEPWPLDPPAARVLFGLRLQRSLALAAAQRASRGADAGRLDAWYALQRATQTRARSAFVRSLAGVDAHPRPDALVPVRILVGTERRHAVRGRLARTGSDVELLLPFDWLWSVWARNGGLAGGHFVLGAGDALTVVTWRPSGGREGEHVPEAQVLRRP